MSTIKKLIEKKDYNGLRNQLARSPKLVNEGITIPFDALCRTKAHPLHRLCDPVFSGKLTDEEAIKFAEIFLKFGADIDGDKRKDGGTPLLAAASLHAEQLGIFYIDNGADIHSTYQNNGESALHWASFCGRDKLVEKLIEAGASIDNPDNTHKSTPLGWAIHCLQSNDQGNRFNQINCIKLLIKNGANAIIPDKEKYDFLIALSDKDPELQNLLV